MKAEFNKKMQLIVKAESPAEMMAMELWYGKNAKLEQVGEKHNLDGSQLLFDISEVMYE